MLRKMLVAGIVILASSNVVFAKSQFYMGARLGYEVLKANLRDPTFQSRVLTGDGANGGVYGGFGTTPDMCQRIYLGAELFADESFFNTDTKTINTGVGAQTASDYLRKRYSFGASFIPGFILANGSMVYGRIGTVRTQFQLHQTIVPAEYTSNRQSRYMNGGQVGVGFQGQLTNLWAVRGEVTYSAYPSYWFFYNKLQPRDAQFNLGVTYTFV